MKTARSKINYLAKCVKRFRGGLVFKAHRLVYHSTLGSRAMNKNRKSSALRGWASHLECAAPVQGEHDLLAPPVGVALSGKGLGRCINKSVLPRTVCGQLAT